ncbi:alpha/beta fold hydrolase [Mucilaginibacter aquaedulcis]|uniref:alpha/beta fold hydrolase n=1 Tax=Mucilaginibacter aquaedulcis TaxID=1187081 RepID=UPI0025B397EE|nr:alpha/beta hydrolase [Mucilaginibacter aquaedulcis]MDN3547224.1 alpha/beta hydrolase [Mucilaginibacter aquaedulcis]
MQIQKLRLAFMLLAGLIICSCNRTSKVNYGDNAAVGKYYNVRGIKLYTETYGTGKPLLLIHGNGGNISAFSHNIPYFSKKYKVIAVDSRAHGKSRDDRDSLSFEMMVDDFAALLDTMHIDSAYVIGWSDGGINALELAMRHPEKVIKLASTGANLWPDSTGLIPSYWKGEQKEYNAKKNTVFKTAKEKNDWKIFLLDWFQPNIKLSELKAIKCPSLIIGGDHDLIPTPHTILISQNIPSANLWIVPNSGHETLIQHSDEFNKKVNDFFEQPFRKK